MTNSKKVYKTDKAFGIAGRAWAAIKGDEVVEIVSMGIAPKFLVEDVMRDIGRTRITKKVYAELERREAQAFRDFRLATRERLAQLGQVMGGVASCGEFCATR